MNIYPNNFYSNYQYHNAYPGNQFSSQQAMNNFNSNLTTPQNYSMNLLGKIVDGEDIVKATEVPLGSFGVFPKADLSEIYIKTWTQEGATKILKFKQVIEEPKEEITLNSLMERVSAIEKKLNEMAAPKDTVVPEKPRKEMKLNAY